MIVPTVRLSAIFKYSLLSLIFLLIFNTRRKWEVFLFISLPYKRVCFYICTHLYGLENCNQPPALESILSRVRGDQVRCFSLCTQSDSLRVNKIKANKNQRYCNSAKNHIWPPNLRPTWSTLLLFTLTHSWPVCLFRQVSLPLISYRFKPQVL